MFSFIDFKPIFKKKKIKIINFKNQNDDKYYNTLCWKFDKIVQPENISVCKLWAALICSLTEFFSFLRFKIKLYFIQKKKKKSSQNFLFPWRKTKPTRNNPLFLSSFLIKMVLSPTVPIRSFTLPSILHIRLFFSFSNSFSPSSRSKTFELPLTQKYSSPLSPISLPTPPVWPPPRRTKTSSATQKVSQWSQNGFLWRSLRKTTPLQRVNSTLRAPGNATWSLNTVDLCSCRWFSSKWKLMRRMSSK